MDAATSAQQWSVDEIHNAIRKRRQLEFCYPGLVGRIVEVSETPLGVRIAVVTTFPGRAYLSAASILRAPPRRLAPGALAATPYGPGIVREFRASASKLDYAVELGSALGSGGAKLGIAYIDADEVAPRSRVFSEYLADAEAARARGNAAYSARDSAAAAAAYTETVEIVRQAYSALERVHPELVVKLLDSAVRAASNNAQVHLSAATPDFARALQHTDEGLRMDSRNLTGSHEKLLFRRAKALVGLGDHEAAASVLRHPLLVQNKDARTLLAASLAELRRQEKEMWGGKLAAAAAASPRGARASAESPGAADTPPPSPDAGAGARRGTPKYAKAPRGGAGPSDDATGTAEAEALRDGESDTGTGGGLLIGGLVLGGLALAAAAAAYFFWGRGGGGAAGSAAKGAGAAVRAAPVAAAVSAAMAPAPNRFRSRYLG